MHYFYIGGNCNQLNDSKSGRQRAALMSASEWSRIGEHLKKEKKLSEEADKKRIEDERRKALSKEMAKTWDNTVLNLRRRRLELRRQRAENLENDRKKRFLQMRQEEADLKKQVIDAAKQVLQGEKDSVKNLISTLRFSEVLRERAEQLKFQSKLNDIEAEREHKEVKKILEDVRKFKEEEREKEAMNIEKKKRLTAEAQEQFKQYFERKKKEEEERIKLEREDNINIVKEINMEKENSLIERERKKFLIMDDVIQNRKMIKEFLEKKKLEEEEEDNAVQIHAAAKKKIAFIRKIKENEMLKKAQERRNRISLLLSSEEADRVAKEEAILKKANDERDALEEEDRKNKKLYKERLISDLKQERKNFLEREEQRRLKENEEEKWRLMQRFKQVEENEKFYKEMQMDKIKKMQENRATWDKQCEERAAAAAEERDQDYVAVKRAIQWWEDEDKEFLTYAENLMEESKKKGRPLLPMMKYIEQYKKENNLLKPPPLHKTWKSNVPIDSSSKETQTSLPFRKMKFTTKPTDTNNSDENKIELKRKQILDSQQKANKSIEPWPKCGEICSCVPQNANGLQKG